MTNKSNRRKPAAPEYISDVRFAPPAHAGWMRKRNHLRFWWQYLADPWLREVYEPRDAFMLAILVSVAADVERLEKQVAASPTNKILKATLKQLRSDLLRLHSDFGLTPESRNQMDQFRGRSKSGNIN